MKLEAQTQARLFIGIIIILIIVITGTSLVFNIQNSKKQAYRTALESSRSFFMGIVSIRTWNAVHGGVYVILNDEIKPNPYLVDPLRDLVTTGGLKLTKINPAFMTRLVSDILKNEKSVEFHITSLKPLNPHNAPDAWEEKALARFKDGIPEVSQVIEGKDSLFRFMAPLVTEKPCLACHAKQGYKLGDIRGGISVTLPFGVYIDSITESKKLLYLFHALFVFFGVGFTIILGALLVSSIKKLKGATSKIETLSGLLPICSSCKKIRDTKGYWKQVELYVEEHSGATFSHGICEECAEKLYGDKDWYKKADPDENKDS